MLVRKFQLQVVSVTHHSDEATLNGEQEVVGS